MANYATLKAAINAVIKANGNKEITGTVLNETLTAMVNSLGANYQFAGVATPSTNPGTPDQNVFYIAGQAGTYTNFNTIVLPDGVSILKWNGSWSSETILGVDDEPTDGSHNLAESGGIKNVLNKVVPSHFVCAVGSNVFRHDFRGSHSYIIQNNTSQSINVRVGDNSNIDHYQNMGNVGAGETKEFTVDNNYTYQYLYIYSNEANSDAVVLYDKNYYIEEIESLHQKDDELDAGKLDASAIKVSIVSNNIFDAQHNLLRDTIVDNVGDIGSADGWQVAKIAVKEGDVITYGRFSLGRSGYVAYYLGNTKVSYWNFNDPEGGVCETLTVPSGVDTLYIDIVSPATIGAESPYFTANYGTVLKEWDEYEEAVTDIGGHKIAGSASSQSLESIVIDLPVSDGTGIDSGYAYIDSTDRTVKVKA